MALTPEIPGAQNIPIDLATSSPQFRKGLTFSTKIVVYHKPPRGGVQTVLCQNYPIEVLRTYCSALSDQLQREPSPTSVIVQNGEPDNIQEVLLYLVRYCHSRPGYTSRYKFFRKNPYAAAYRAYRSAYFLGISRWMTELRARVEAMEQRQIRAEDIRDLYLFLSTINSGHPRLQLLAEHVANLYFHKNLRGASAYFTLAEELPLFDRLVRQILELKLAARQSEGGANVTLNTEVNDTWAEPSAPLQHRTVSLEKHSNATQGKKWYQVPLGKDGLDIKHYDFVAKTPRKRRGEKEKEEREGEGKGDEEGQRYIVVK